eukprot:10275506-Ditylum_brightwellii.AAC.1
MEEEEEDLEELPPEEWEKWAERVMVVEKEEFPYLGMKMYWKNKELQFAVHHKENQTIKFVSKDSCNRPSVFKLIPAGFFTCMGRLTSLTLQNAKISIMKLYPLHDKAFKKANLLLKNVPTVGDLYQAGDNRQRRAKKKEEKKE